MEHQGSLHSFLVIHSREPGVSGNFRCRIKGAKYRFVLQDGTWDHERLPEILVVPREKTPTGAAARGNP